MARKLSLQKHLSAPELKVLYRSSTDPVESRRYHLLWLVTQGSTLSEAAPVVGLNYDYAYEIVGRYNRQGLEGLKNGCKQRQPPKSSALLNEQQQAELAERLQTPPDDGGVWTGPKVARWIEQVTGRSQVWNQRGWDYLKRLNHSWQRPRPKHAKGDPEAQAAFKKNCPNAKSN